MKNITISILATLLLPFFSRAQAPSDNHYIYFNNGSVEAYPKKYVKGLELTEGNWVLTLEGDTTCTWSSAQIDSVSETSPLYPQFTALKFDDKLNEQLVADVDAIIEENRVTASVGAIGKWLTPSYKTDSQVAKVYVNGVEQVNGRSRLRFADEVIYTLSLPGHSRLSVEKVSDEVWSDAEYTVKEIALTEEMLSTNAPTSIASEGLGMMLDGNTSTFFHSTWSADEVYDVDLTQQVYISVTLEKPISDLQFSYTGRMNDRYNVQEWRIEISADGVQWQEVTLLDETHGLPVSGIGIPYTSPTISLGAPYNHIRFVATKVGYKNYLCISEFSLYEVISSDEGPELLEPARYAYRMMPLGREVTVDINWLTDNAAVPRVDIDIDGGEMVSSKEYYLKALITIQGQGVWPDFQDSVQIKGRGNSSWSSNPSAKNPYRLKFASAVKPFGLKKGKNWNLIAQAQRGSMMSNPMAMKLARMVDAAGANDVIPIDLYMNGAYRGSYIFTQKTGLSNNSIDLEDESAAVFLELDDYYDETYRFYSTNYRLPVNIKEPDFSEGETLLDFEQTKQDFNRFETSVYQTANFERLVDVDMLTRFMFVNELVLNTEIGHPKSVFLYKENLNALGSPYVFGPVWDFDWSYGYEGDRGYCTSAATQELFDFHTSGKGNKFFSALWQTSQLVKRHYYSIWRDFMDNHLQEFIDYTDDYLAYANNSFIENSYYWNDGNNYSSIAENMKVWLEERAHHIMSSLTPFDLEAPIDYPYGDINTDGLIDDTDKELLLNALLDDATDNMDFTLADVDATGELTVSDIAWLCDMASDETAARARRHSLIDVWLPDNEEEDTDDIDTRAISAPQRATSSMRTTDESTSAWSQTLTTDDGLPGITNGRVYEYTSPLITPSAPIERLRLTVTESNTGDSGSGYVCFALAEFFLYDSSGNPIGLTADNFTTNAQEPKEGPLPDIVDGDIYTYFHSTWSEEADAEHYIEITLPEPMAALSFSYISRNERTVPTTITLSAGGAAADDDNNEDMSPDGIGVTLSETIPGMEWSMTVSMNNQQDYTAFQMDLDLPDGIGVFDATTDLTPAPRLQSFHTLAGDYLSDGRFRVIAYSDTNANIDESEEALFTLLLTADRNLSVGDYQLTLDNIRMVTSAGFELAINEVTGSMHISETSMDTPDDAPFRIVYYTVEGEPLAAPRPGIVICRKVYSDGRVEVIKRMYQ